MIQTSIGIVSTPPSSAERSASARLGRSPPARAPIAASRSTIDAVVRGASTPLTSSVPRSSILARHRAARRVTRSDESMPPSCSLGAPGSRSAGIAIHDRRRRAERPLGILIQTRLAVGAHLDVEPHARDISNAAGAGLEVDDALALELHRARRPPSIDIVIAMRADAASRRVGRAAEQRRRIVDRRRHRPSTTPITPIEREDQRRGEHAREEERRRGPPARRARRRAGGRPPVRR